MTFEHTKFIVILLYMSVVFKVLELMISMTDAPIPGNIARWRILKAYREKKLMTLLTKVFFCNSN